MSPASSTPGFVRATEDGRKLFLAVPHDGAAVIGSSGDANIRLPYEGVSRRHAVVESSSGSIVLRDLGSTNGTWVNGERITTRRLLHGDSVRLGTISLEFKDELRRSPHKYSGPPGPSTSAGRYPENPPSGSPKISGRVRLARTLAVAALIEIVLLAGNAVITSAAGWTGLGSWLSVPLLGVLAAGVDVLKQKSASEASPTGRPQAPAARHQPTMMPAAALLIGVLVMGGGGLAAMTGVRFISGYITGNEDGVERLLETAEVTAKGLRMTVTSVKQTTHFTRVELVAESSISHSLEVRLHGGNCLISSADGTAIEADAGRSRWSSGIAPGTTRRGTITFQEHLPNTQTTASLSFNHIFGFGFEGPDSITVPNIQLRSVSG